MRHFCEFLVVAAIMGGCVGCAHEERLERQSRAEHERVMLDAGYCRSTWDTTQWQKCH